VRGYPTLIFFKEGKIYRYKQQRDPASLREFMKSGYLAISAEEIPKKTQLSFFSMYYVTWVLRKHPMYVSIGLIVVVLSLFFICIKCVGDEEKEDHANDKKTHPEAEDTKKGDKDKTD
jgi:uncharacterized membrane protein